MQDPSPPQPSTFQTFTSTPTGSLGPAKDMEEKQKDPERVKCKFLQIMFPVCHEQAKVSIVSYYFWTTAEPSLFTGSLAPAEWMEQAKPLTARTLLTSKNHLSFMYPNPRHALLEIRLHWSRYRWIKWFNDECKRERAQFECKLFPY